MKLSICVPSYNGEKTIAKAINSILAQSYKNFEIIINDDCSIDNTEKIVKSIKDTRIHFYKNSENLGYGDNLKTFRSKISGDVMVMMAQDDILLKNALQKIVDGFSIDKDIAIVTRPYYQFEANPKIPVRYWPPPSTTHNTIISINSEKPLIEAAIRSTYLVSCLAYKVKYLKTPFNSHVMTSQAYPFFEILKKHKIAFLKDYVVAVGIYESQCRHKPSIYIPSPVKTWIEVFDKTLPEKKYDKIRKICQDYVAQNYVGLIQIKNYGTMNGLIKEILNHIKYRKKSLIDLRFWMYSGLSLIVPRFLLWRLVDMYKSQILSRVIRSKVAINI